VSLSLGRSQEDGWKFALVASAAFAIVQLVGHTHHEMWRDELHCFGIGRHAKGLWDLLNGDRRYEGHPFLWYYLLHLTAKVDRSYLGLHVLTWSLAVGGALLWTRYAPVPRVLKVLALGSYYLAYEYGVICRSYTLGVFLTFAVCAVYRRDRVRYVPLALLLILLGATSVYGFAIALSLSLFVFTRGPTVETAAGPPPRKRVAVPVTWIVGLSVLLVGLAIVAWTTRPPEDAAYRPADLPALTSGALRDAAIQYWRALFPYKGLLDWSWVGNQFLGEHVPAARSVIPWVGGVWLACWLFALRRSPRVAIAYAFGTIVMAAIPFAVYSYVGWRHIGNNFVLLLACIWLHARDRERRAPSRLVHLMFAANLTVQVLTAAGAFVVDYRTAFSRATEAAHVIKDRHLEGLPVVGDSDAPVSPIAVILDHSFHYPSTGAIGQTPVFNNSRSSVSGQDLLREASRLARESGGRALLILDSAHGALQGLGKNVTLVWTGGPAVVSDESYYVYEVGSQ
jgi:hypothetical protein